VNAPSGEQHVIVFGEQTAVVTEIGATLRSYVDGTTAVCWGFDEDQMSGGGRGQLLAPWPNRLRDGLYEFRGISAHAPIDEVARMVAIHGLVRWVPWRLVEKHPDRVVLDYRLHPQPAYPFGVHLVMTYVLGRDGLEGTLEAVAEGDGPIPFGAGFHSYISGGSGGVDSVRLAVPASSRFILDDRALPVGVEAVEGTPSAAIAGNTPFAEREAIGALRVDDCYTGVFVEPDGKWRALVQREGEDRPVTVWAESVFKHIMCFTGDTLPPGDRRLGIAIEPMTCPPDAFRTGEDLIVLEPGASFSGSWGITPA